MPKYLLFILFLLFISCNYQKTQKDKYPEMQTFSEVISNPEKSKLKYFSGKREDIQALFILEKQCITVSYVREHESQNSSDSIVISKYKSFTDCKKIYYNIELTNNDSTKNEVNQLKNIDLYKIEMIDDAIYTLYHKFSPPDYKPQMIDSLFWKNRDEKLEVYNIASFYNNENILKPFESIVIGHSTLCGGGRLGGSLICPVYLDYYKISSIKKTVYFKERSSLNAFKILKIFGENCLLYNGGYGPHGNSSLFIIDE